MSQFGLPDRMAASTTQFSTATNDRSYSGTVPILNLPQQASSVEKDPIHSSCDCTNLALGSSDSYRASIPSYFTSSQPSLPSLNTSLSTYPRSLPDHELQYLRSNRSPFTSPLSSPLHALESPATFQGAEESQPISWQNSALSSQIFPQEEAPFPDAFSGVGANASWASIDVDQEVTSNIPLSDHDAINSRIENINADVWFPGRPIPEVERYVNPRPNDTGILLNEPS